MSSNWWTNKLNTPSQPGGLVLPPVQHTPQQQPVPYYGSPAQMPPQQQPVYQRGPQPHDDPNRKLSLREAVSRFSGGEGVRTEGNMACPSCGSFSGFTAFSGMAGAGAGVMGNRPAPHCFECGYNGKFIQGQPPA